MLKESEQKQLECIFTRNYILELQGKIWKFAKNGSYSKPYIMKRKVKYNKDNGLYEYYFVWSPTRIKFINELVLVDFLVNYYICHYMNIAGAMAYRHAEIDKYVKEDIQLISTYGKDYIDL